MITADDIIRILNLQKHPTEGGYFLETYRSKNATAIYYMITDEADSFSEMHQLSKDEIFHFYLGDPVEMLHLYPDGTGKRMLLGTHLNAGMQPQVLIPAGVWQGARLLSGGKFALMGTTMAPGFAYSDYQSASQKVLTARYPEFKELIITLTRNP